MVTLSVCTFRVHSWMKALDHFQGLRKAEGPFQRIFIHVDTLWSNDSNRKSNLVFEKTTIYTGVQKPFSVQKELQVGQKLVSYIESFSKWKCQFHWNKIEVSDMRFCIHTTWFCKDSILLTSRYWSYVFEYVHIWKFRTKDTPAIWYANERLLWI